MFDSKIPLFIRGLSCFDIVLPLSYLVSNAKENVNWVYGLGGNPQRILPAPLFVILLMLLFPLAVYLPTHLLFARIFRAAVA